MFQCNILFQMKRCIFLKIKMDLEGGSCGGWQVYKAQDCHSRDQSLTSEPVVWLGLGKERILVMVRDEGGVGGHYPLGGLT